MNSYTNSRPFTAKERAFIKWYLAQQKKVFSILIIVLIPFIVVPLGAMIYFVKDKILGMETSEYIKLAIAMGVLFLLLRLLVKFIRHKLQPEFPVSIIQFSGIYHLDEVNSVLSGIDTTVRNPIVLPKIGNYIIAASEGWRFVEGQFYEVEAAILKLSSFESRMYKSSHQYLLLKKQFDDQQIRIEDDVDRGLLGTSNLIVGTLLVFSVISLSIGVPFSLSLLNEINPILWAVFLLVAVVAIWSFIRLLRNKRIIKKIREYHHNQ